MFYSHQLLARKGPLGTVWCAAHAQHRLKKPQYSATDIPSTVDLIMYPETPMALRMSGHLLLGVVRIYSKKVDYLHHDLNHLYTWIGKAFLTVQVDLPENARQAPVESVTLPQALNLDEFDLEDDTLEREFNNHRLNEEDITLTDQIPTGIDPYVAVTFDEDIFPESSPMDVDQFTVPVSEHTERTDVDMVHEAGPDSSAIPKELNRNTERSHPSSPTNFPEIEKKREAEHDLSSGSHLPFAAEQQSERVEPAEALDDTLNEKEPSSTDAEMLSPRKPLALSPGLADSEERGDFVHPSAQLTLPPSPPLSPTRPRKRMRFDKVTVLTNRIMKERLEDPSDTLCKRKKLPSSKIGVWRLNNQSKKDQCFNEPLFTGFSDALRSVFEKDCVSSKPYLAVSDETLPQPASVSTPTRETETEINLTSPIPQPMVPDSSIPDSTVQLSPVQQTGDVQGLASTRPAYAESVATEEQTPQTLEHLRDGGHPEFMPTPPPRSSPSRIHDFTTQPGTRETGSYRTESSPSTIPVDRPGLRDDKGIEHFRRDGGQPESMPSPPPRSSPSGIGDFTTQTGTELSPSIIPEDRPGPSDDKEIEHLKDGGHAESMPRFSPVREMTAEDLVFLESGGNTPVRSPASQDSDTLSKRTRALVQYLKERSSSSPTTSQPSEDLSLNEILTGKTRKLAARMFFETLVLKSRGLIDMQQDQPYGDITLKLKPALFSKVQT